MNFEKMTTYLDSLKERYGVRACECMILRDHEMLFHHLTGTSDFENTIPLHENNLHDVFSASKVMTMVAVMQLVEQGKIGLEDSVERYLPEFGQIYVVQDFDLTQFVSSAGFAFGWPGAERGLAPAENKIKIWHLMSMTAGVNYNVGSQAVLELLQTNPHAGTREIVREYAKSPLLYEPGTRYAYSLGHDILAAVVEVVSGMKFSDYMRKYVFDPVGADQMFYQVPASEKERLTVLYGYDPVNKKHIPQTVNFARINDTYESGGAGIACTVGSYIKVLDALANDGIAATGAQILCSDSIKEMSRCRLTPQQLDDFHIGGKHEYGYALGVRTLLDPTKSKSPLGEFGWDGAAGAYALVDPVNHLSLFYVQAAPESGPAFATIHPTLRDLMYDAVFADEV